VKGIILAGGVGRRLFPITKSVSKQLLPVFDKPMIYYPLTTLMLAGINDILIITTPSDEDAFKKLIGDGSKWGIKVQYKPQPEPGGIAQAILIGSEFIGVGSCALILGDNIFYGQGLASLLQSVAQRKSGATAFAYRVRKPEQYGVVDFDSEGKALEIVEKPDHPKTNFAVTGLYFYDSKVVEYVTQILPSARGELEITDINNLYIKDNALRIERLDRGYAWLDSGTPESLLQASQFVSTIEERQGLKIACPEEVAYRMKFIDVDDLSNLARDYSGNDYGQYLISLVEDMNKTAEP